MTPTDMLDWLTVYRAGAMAILGFDKPILGTVSTARLNLDLSGVVRPHMASPTVTAGPAMPPPDAPSVDGQPVPAKKWGSVLGTCRKFDHPDKLLAIVAAFQHLQAKMADEITFTGHDGKSVTMLAGSALSAVL
jgi:hypothetical protein